MAIYQFDSLYHYFSNTFAAIITVFVSLVEIAATWGWLIVHDVPVIGFIMYFFFGRRIRKNASLICVLKKTIGLQELVEQQQREPIYTKEKSDPQNSFYKNPYQEDLASFFLEADDAIITENNDVEMFVDGQEKFEPSKRRY